MEYLLVYTIMSGGLSDRAAGTWFPAESDEKAIELAKKIWARFSRQSTPEFVELFNLTNNQEVDTTNWIRY